MKVDEMGIEYEDHRFKFELVRHYNREGAPIDITNNVISSSSRYEFRISGHDKNKGRAFKNHEAHIEVFDTEGLIGIPTMVMDVYIYHGYILCEFIVVNHSFGTDHKQDYYIYGGSVDLDQPRHNPEKEGFTINFNLYLRTKPYLLVQNIKEMWQIKTDKGAFITPRFRDSNLSKASFRVSNTFELGNTNNACIKDSELLRMLRSDLFMNILTADSFKVKDEHDKDILEFDNNTWSWLDYDYKE